MEEYSVNEIKRKKCKIRKLNQTRKKRKKKKADFGGRKTENWNMEKFCKKAE